MEAVPEDMHQLELEVGGMMCERCVARVTVALEAEPGVQNATVTLEPGKATIIFAAPATHTSLCKAVADAGKSARLARMSEAEHPKIRLSSTGEGVHLKISGMTCHMCVGRIQKALEAVDGVASATVVLEPGSAVVIGTASVAALIEAVEDTGKEASLMVAPESVHLKVDGMTCHMCVGRIKKALEALDGVVSASVVLEPDTLDGSAVVVGTASVAALIEAVEDTGKEASLMQEEQEPEKVYLQVGGMTCHMCVGRIKKALEALDGVVSAEVVLEQDTLKGSAVIVGTASVAALIEAVEDTGKEASLMPDDVSDDVETAPAEPKLSLEPELSLSGVKIRNMASTSPPEGEPAMQAKGTVETFSVTGMTCSSCSGRIEVGLADVPVSCPNCFVPFR